MGVEDEKRFGTKVRKDQQDARWTLYAVRTPRRRGGSHLPTSFPRELLSHLTCNDIPFWGGFRIDNAKQKLAFCHGVPGSGHDDLVPRIDREFFTESQE